MSHIRDRLSDYHDFMKKLVDDHQMVLASDVLEMIEQLKDDLEQDEKDFYGYRRKTVAVLYERMRLFGVWEDE